MYTAAKLHLKSVQCQRNAILHNILQSVQSLCAVFVFLLSVWPHVSAGNRNTQWRPSPPPEHIGRKKSGRKINSINSWAVIFSYLSRSDCKLSTSFRRWRISLSDSSRRTRRTASWESLAFSASWRSISRAWSSRISWSWIEALFVYCDIFSFVLTNSVNDICHAFNVENWR